MNFTVWESVSWRGQFDGRAISSDGCGLLLSEVEARTHIVERLAKHQ